MYHQRVFLATLTFAAAVAAPNPSTVTFNKDVLPILQKNCQSCHRPGEIAPMSLLSYSEARPWAKAIKAAVAARKMPPWFAEVGHFANDRTLSEADIKTLSAWADNGAPEGDAKDKPAPRTFTDGWQIKPDMGERRRDAAQQFGRAASRKGLGGASGIEVDGGRAVRRALRRPGSRPQ